MMKEASKPIPRREIPWLILFSLPFLYLLWLFIAPVVIRYQGVCIKAVLTDVTHSSKTGSWREYSFCYQGKVYDGNSTLGPNESRAGDSICIAFLSWTPDRNRPLIYYSSPIHCKCK